MKTIFQNSRFPWHAIALAILLIAGPAPQSPAGAQKTGKVTGLEIPRFVSLRSGKVNLRTGPGTRYPVEWVLTYRNMPVEVLDEFDTWRKIRDWQGSTGWVHRSLLSGKRWVIVPDNQILLRRDPRPNAGVIARIAKKNIGRLETCRGIWCQAAFSGFDGWIKRAEIWGVYKDETFK